MTEQRPNCSERWDFTLGELRRKSLSINPLDQFSIWYQEAIKNNNITDASAFSLATTNAKGHPSVRTVLLRFFDSSGFVFFTNYTSQKSNDINSNSQVSMLFPWLALERQIRISGQSKKISRDLSEAYFLSRPRESQISAWSSHQSTSIASRTLLEEQHDSMHDRFIGKPIPLPQNWGGYVIKPHSYEFWQGRRNRLHDRFLYSKSNKDSWSIERLSP